MVRKVRTYVATGVLVCASLALLGCRTAGRPVSADRAAQTQPTSRRAGAQDVIAGSDARRAVEALERDWPRGERQPASPPRRPVVDQPRPSRR